MPRGSLGFWILSRLSLARSASQDSDDDEPVDEPNDADPEKIIGEDEDAILDVIAPIH